VALVGLALAFVPLITACRQTVKTTAPAATTARPPAPPPRPVSDEIVVCGKRFHIGTPVVLWTDPGGYNGYQASPAFAPMKPEPWSLERDDSPTHFGSRTGALPRDEARRVNATGWSLTQLQRVVDQFVLHYDGSGVSRECFRTIHDGRGLSVHFMVDIDGTIYQTLDLQERAWHATTSNDRSVGVEIANVGAFDPITAKLKFEPWFAQDVDGSTRITIPAKLGDGGVRTPGFVGRPARPMYVQGRIHGKSVQQYDFTPQQYAALIKLTAGLCRVFPKMKCDYPRDSAGGLIRGKLPDKQLNRYAGVIGHYHIQTNKIDPGPAFQWDLVIDGAREELKKR